MGQILRLQRLTPFPLRMTGGVVKTPPGLYPFDSLRSLRVTVVGMVFYNIFCIRWVKYRSDPSTSDPNGSFAQDDKLGGLMPDMC